MDKNSNTFTVGFALVMCVVLSFVLATVAGALKPTIDANRAFDIRKHALKAAGLYDPDAEDQPSREEFAQLYTERVREEVVRLATGEIVEGMTFEELGRLRDRTERDSLGRVYRIVGAGSGETTGYVLPTKGYGLWSWLYGFIALDAEAKQVSGLTFYQHAETPGLGGEVDNPEWQQQWQGKSIFKNGEAHSDNFIGVIVKKGPVDRDNPRETASYVDGLSGATITSNGVTKAIRHTLGRDYWSYFVERGLWQGEQPVEETRT